MNIYDVIKEIDRFLRQHSIAQSDQFVTWLASRPLIESWGRREVYQACLGRLPERLPDIERWDYASRDECALHIVTCLVSPEFRTNIVQILTTALPDLRRTFFVHIPRTGGTAVQIAVDESFHGLAWNASFANDEWLGITAEGRRLDELQFMLLFLRQFIDPGERLLVLGHMPLSHILAQRIVRPDDRVFTAIRDPRQIIVSTVKYILDIVRSKSQKPDARDWRQWLDAIDRPELYAGTIDAAGVSAMVRSERFAREYANPLTRYLSDDGTPEGALFVLDLVRADVLTRPLIAEYLERELGLSVNVGDYNSSQTQVHDLLDERDIAFIDNELCGKDRKLMTLFDTANSSFKPWRPRVTAQSKEVAAR